MVCIAALLLAACGGRPADTSGTAGGTLVTDDLGRQIRVPASPGRVVTLAPSVTEIVYAAGAFDRVAAVTTADNYPPGVDSLPKITALPVDFEAVAILEADLVLATTQVNNPQDAETFETLGIPTYFLSNRSIDEILSAIIDVGDLLGTADAARATVDSLRASMSALRELTASASERPNVMVIISPERSYSFGPESYVHDLIELAGGRSLTEDFTTEAPILEDEFVLVAAPDVIIGPFGPEFKIADLLEHHPTWIHVPAVANGRVHTVPADELLRAGPRVVDAAWSMARVLHPDVFGSDEALRP